MELEEMQAVWSELSDQLETQKKLTNKMIIMMTKEKYRSKINKIAIPEILGTVICYGTIVLILANFSRLDNWYNMLSGLISMVILLILPVLSLRSIHRMKRIDIAKNSYQQTLLSYTKAKKRFQTVAKWGYYLSFVLMFAILPVSAKVLNNKDLIADSKSVWPFVVAIPLAIAFVIFFAKWVMRSYNSNINAAENLIKEISEVD